MSVATRARVACLVAVSVSLAVCLGGSLAQAQSITGAGSSLGAPIYAKWGADAKQATGVELNYQSVGSGAGQNAVISRNVDFGASDAPVTPDRLASNHLVQFPSVMGAVVVIANVPGIKNGALRLNGPVIADIYLGRVKRWNDKEIAALNPKLKLPGAAIAPVYRADASGTTFVFTSYLSAVAPEWKSGVGAATSVKWPAGNGANNSNGVAATVRQVRGGIGYVEYSYAAQNHIPMALLKSHDGTFLEPIMSNFEAAAAKADWAGARNFAVSILDVPGPNSWPIVTPTFILVPDNPKDPAKAAGVLKLFDWAYKSGAADARALNFIPLPQSVEDQVRQSWAAVKGPDGAAVYK